MKKSQVIILIISTLAVTGIGYFVYTRFRNMELNRKVSTLQEAYDVIDSVDTTGDVIPDDVEPEAEVLYAGNGSDDIGTDEIGYTLNGAELYYSPDMQSNLLNTYEADVPLFVIGTSLQADGVWYNVDDGSDKGWVRNDFLDVLPV